MVSPAIVSNMPGEAYTGGRGESSWPGGEMISCEETVIKNHLGDRLVYCGRSALTQLNTTLNTLVFVYNYRWSTPVQTSAFTKCETWGGGGGGTLSRCCHN